jgi:hypothetical protein
MLLAGCSKDSGDSAQQTKQEPQEIRVQTNVTNVLEGRRAQTYSVVGDLQTEAHFTCAAYEANSDPLVAYIPTTTVDWKSTQWQFNDGNSHYYWPLPATNCGAWPSLDFFGYMPKAANLSTEAPYITAGPTYSADHNVTFTCTDLPMSYDSDTPTTGQGSSLKEFMFGMALNQNGSNAADGVPLTFQHPFARIKFQLQANHPDVKIKSITFKTLKTGGTFLYNHGEGTSTWSSLTPAAEEPDLVMSFGDDGQVFKDNPATPTPIGPDFIVIPQGWAGVIEVDAWCLFWGDLKYYEDLTTTIPTNWQPGYSYTYTFNISPDDLIVNIAKFTEQW